jgi:hypothetical protein
VDNVTTSLTEIADKWRDIGKCLYIPDAALKVIASDFNSDLDRLRAVVRYWLLRDPYASWRRLIWSFDHSGDSDMKLIADEIRRNAEKFTTGKSTSLRVMWVRGGSRSE